MCVTQISPMPSSSASTFGKSTTSISIRRRPFVFLSNLLRRRKVLEIDDMMFERGNREMNQRARSEPSVISYSCTQMNAATKAASPSISTLTLTPGRCRDIDQDMQALRLSRQDNPFVQKILASRESLVDTLDDTVSDDAILMSQEFNPELESDPFTLPEVQEHMIRSPPPTTWPRSPHFSIFNFSQENVLTVSSQSSEEDAPNSRSRLNEIFSPNRQIQVTTAEISPAPNMSKSRNCVMLKEHGGTALPRPHSAHHCESDRSTIPRPLSHYEGPLSVRNFK
ncbi:uncharacterized protein LOC129789108 isoform X1 [Lutzomyia longipalpis]|uniref:uncharacterized protein LOC129789108 isoform X1 n=1 Tax=Lutzomyia longipalpis TaxID=7200 RepID=UPI0024837F39|nr:uncharacterized protein LOC129789108 isoform X1 [Lutzomyia longipalpis]